MALRQLLIFMCGMAVLLSLISLVSDGFEWNKTRLYNAAVQKKQYAEAGQQLDNDRGLFATAYTNHQQGKYQEARVIYTMLDNTEDQTLRLDALFNMGNTYLEQASLLDLEKDADRAMPLIELAKTTYRQLLSIDSDHWDARFNLERALQALPDAAPFVSTKSEGARRAARTLIGADSGESLP